MAEEQPPNTPRMPEATSVAPADRQPWERLPEEGEREWAAFKAYRDMEPPRDFQRAGFLGGVRVAAAELHRWYRNHRWAERSAAYDVLTDRIVAEHRKKVLERSAEDITAEHLVTLQRLRRVLLLEVQKYVESAEASAAPGLIKPSDLKGLLEASVKLDRLIRGETTEEVGVQKTDLSEMSIDEIRAWRERIKGMSKK